MNGPSDQLGADNPELRKRLGGKWPWGAFALSTGILLVLPFLVNLDGARHADWQQLIGRFHPLAVHLPIGIFLIVPVIEIAGRFRPALKEAAAFLLGTSVVCSAVSVVLGLLLAHGGGFARGTVSRHMWGGISVAIGMQLCFLLRPWWASGRLPYLYPLALASVVILLGWASHEGGTITYGPGYLTEYLPRPLKAWSGVPESKQAATGSVYAARIQPIFDANCQSCHGAAKTRGKLRLDSYAGLMQGGQDGPVIVSGHPDGSLLFKRITLPSDDANFMPGGGHSPLKDEEKALIAAWITAGAPPTATAVAGISDSTRPQAVVIPPVGDYSGLMGQIAELEKAQGIKLVPVSRNLGDGLILRTIDVAPQFDDARLAQLTPFASYIVDAELGRTRVTDASFDTLARFTHLRALHLEETAITGSGLEKLSRLSELTYLNLTGTQVTKAAIAQISSLKSLEHVYLYNTPAQPASAQTQP
jgi:uncharacterized membrane protein/mono/diheme cytochrome c family protein